MNDFFSMFMQFFGLVIMFGSVLFLVIIVTKVIGNKTKGAMKGKYINVIETVSIGFDKHIYLIKVGDEFFLLASSGKNIEFLSKANPEEIAETNNGIRNIFDFKTLFDKYIRNGGKEKNFKNNNNVDVTLMSNIEKLKKLGNITNDKNGAEIND